MSRRRLWEVGSALLIGSILLIGCSSTPNAQPTPGSSATLGPTANSQPTPAVINTPGDDEDWYLGGTITWTASGSDDNSPPHIESVTGTATVVIHVIDPYLMLAERETPSTYSYDYTSNSDTCPATHEEGTLESQAGVGTTDEWDYSIGTLNPFGPPGTDLSLTISMPDYCGPSMGGTVDRSRGFLLGFPDCESGGDQLFARFDGVDSYVIDCDVIAYGPANEFVGTATGHVSGTLTTVQP